MIDSSSLLLGPMAGPECLRASRRPWVIWVRLAPAVAAGLVTFLVFWAWWIARRVLDGEQQTYEVYTTHPYEEFRVGIVVLEGMLCVLAMILSPAVLAGTLAGEKERGSIGLLLTTRASSLDLVLGRLVSRLTQVFMIELAVIPALLLLAALAGFGWGTTLTLLALPVALSFGNGGVAVAASALSRRGRDALLLVYLIDILCLLGPTLAAIGPGWEWAGWLSPFEPLWAVTYEEVLTPAVITSGAWSLIGVGCVAVAAWRLRPSCLSEGSESRAKKKAKRFGWVPRMDERPMLWKELYIERMGTLGRAGKWIGGLLIAWMGLGSLILGGIATSDYVKGIDSGWGTWSITQMGIWFGGSALYIGFLIQWAIGLRAAVTISSERERGTWDALLTSPLEGGEIIRGKLWGSLYALRWLAGSAVMAWTITAAFGGLLPGEYAVRMIEMAAVGSFMAAIGVRTSLRCSTATKAMSATIGLWLAGYLLALVFAWAICVAGFVFCVFAWLFAVQLGMSTIQSGPWFPMAFPLAANIVFYATMVVSTILIVLETRVRFDRVAGRMTGGATAVAIDHLIHGMPMAPVMLDGYRKRPDAGAGEPALGETIQA